MKSGWIWLLVALTACGGGGGDDSIDASAGADAAAPADAADPSDAIAPLLWVDFTITGCADAVDGDFDAGAPPSCAGAAPLALEFAATAPAPIEVYQWSFGDGAEATDPAPQHAYTDPGTYQVMLVVGGPGGTAMVSRPAAVIARAAELGSPCAEDDHCGDGLACVCDPDAGCGPVLGSGLCSADCGGAACTGGVCADLDPAGGGSAEWQAELCLIDCSADGGCPAGLACRILRDGDGTGWVQGCFLDGVLGDIGDSCVDSAGDPDGALCASGSCLDEGARGMCSDTCTSGTCPDGSACATFGFGSRCVARCDAGEQCTGDPWLACEDAGGAGTKSFTVDEAPNDSGYCAPKRCTLPDQCGPDGTCVSGYCAGS
jgi:PKD repeat protein